MRLLAYVDWEGSSEQGILSRLGTFVNPSPVSRASCTLHSESGVRVVEEKGSNIVY